MNDEIDDQTGSGPHDPLPASFYVAMMESSEDAIVTETLDGIVTSWNRAAERMFGFTAAEMIGRAVTVIAPGREEESARLRARIKAGERIAHHETIRQRKDGQTVAISLSISPLRDAVGHLLGAIRISHNITEERRLRLENAEREGLLLSILETIPDALIVIDERGTIQSFSTAAERLFGYRADEVSGQNVKVLMPSPHQEHHDDYLHRYMTTGERRIIGTGRVVAGLRKDGTTFPMELSVGEVTRAGRRLFTGFVRDLTQRQTAERRIQELQSELLHVARLTEMGQMASGLAHELNQPLTAAANYLQALRRLVDRGDESSLARARSAAESAVGQVARAGEIIRRLREFVKKSEPERREESIVSLIEEASGLALIGAREYGIEVRFRTASELPLAFVDKVQVQQVLVNLIRNAVEAMQASPRRSIVVETHLDGEGLIRVGVLDSGPGIAPEVLERLFQPFVTTKAQGMGVGLSLCRAIIEAHGGRLWAEPNPDGGAIFRFTVPPVEGSDGAVTAP
ncbi:MAG TPA: PAS domain S-box protein [Stellaceae bacterium]|nr:PAS domain S-box protein [Stellaceae bacterium]